MAIEKITAVDKIIIRSPYNHIELRKNTIITEDNEVIAQNFKHETIAAGKLDHSNNWVDTDMSGYSTEIQGVATAVWTDSVKTALKEFLLAN
tara:strand:+ start:176 stop:451 length:276 start_codon:yes stop_codon:yes gene_type:complete